MDTETSYLGFRLPHPFIAGASPFGYQITLASRGRIRNRDPLDREFAVALADFPASDDYPLRPQEYAEHINRVKQAIGIPVIGSLNGTSAESWLAFSRIIEQAGADALELNSYEVVTDLSMSGLAVEHQARGDRQGIEAPVEDPDCRQALSFFCGFRKCRAAARCGGCRRPPVTYGSGRTMATGTIRFIPYPNAAVLQLCSDRFWSTPRQQPPSRDSY